MSPLLRSRSGLLVTLPVLAALAIALPLTFTLPQALAQQPAVQEPPGGVKIGHRAYLRSFVSAQHIEQTAAVQYQQLTREAKEKSALLPESDPTVQRVRKIAQNILPHTLKFNERTKDWQWEVNVLNSKQVNAFCMPGGKIAVFTGLITQLKLSDDELAMVIGHEIAHALREHARSRAAKESLTAYGALAVSVLAGGNFGELARIGGGLLNLKFSRGDETEADLVGMELAARSGYDPRSGIVLWEKMSQLQAGSPGQLSWLSTHPSGPARIAAIKANLKDVLPIYEQVATSGGRKG